MVSCFDRFAERPKRVGSITKLTKETCDVEKRTGITEIQQSYCCCTCLFYSAGQLQQYSMLNQRDLIIGMKLDKTFEQRKRHGCPVLTLFLLGGGVARNDKIPHPSDAIGRETHGFFERSH